eukprot:g679.t1
MAADDTTPFFVALSKRCREIDSVLCVGLDPHAVQLAEGQKNAAGAKRFCLDLIEKTSHVAAAYKPNAAFFEAFGAAGQSALEEVIAAVPAGIPVLLDCKRGDISSTAAAYAAAAYDVCGAHGVTLSPYMGRDSLAPFVDPAKGYAHKGAFLLCKTSNPSSADFQAQALAGGALLYEEVATRVEAWAREGAGAAGGVPNLGLVVGATDAEGMRRARGAAPSLWILAPGLGAQGGDLETCLTAAMWRGGQSEGADADATWAGGGVLFPVSRGISKAADPKAAAEQWRERLNAARRALLGDGAGGARGSKRAHGAVDGADGADGGGQPRGRAAARARAAAAAQATGAEQAATTDAHAFLELALRREVLRFGAFTLKSGRESPYFFNAGLFNSGSDLLHVGRFYARAIVRWGLEFDVIFGPAYKGITLAAAIAIALADAHGRDIPYAYNRKEKKDHGEGGQLVGAAIAGKRVLVVDDVITAGTAIRESMGLLQAAGAQAVGVLVALDRQEKGPGQEGGAKARSAIESVADEFGLPVRSVATLVELQGFVAARNAPGDAELLQRVAAYRAKYGVC